MIDTPSFSRSRRSTRYSGAEVGDGLLNSSLGVVSVSGGLHPRLLGIVLR
ncbi:hypothetical protein [Leekyejoonella antrihumi]|nr:hypothetical protein [Leekyejoonella antrihumi]